MKELFDSERLPASQFQQSYWMIRGFSEEESKNKIREIQSRTSKKKIFEKLITSGKTEQEASDILKEHSKKISERAKAVHKRERENDHLYVKKMSRFFKEFWIKKGYSEEESIFLAQKASKDNRKKFREKLDSGEIQKGWNNTTIEYYLKKGMSLDDAKISLIERQRTFTLEKCIDKYGEEQGRQIWMKG
jgi:hypothetical protein